MAELFLKVRNGSAFTDGDIMCALNQRCIRCCHAEQICRPRHQPVNRDGLLATGTVAQDWFENTHQYRIERISRHEIRRTEIRTGANTVLSSTPNRDGEICHVEEYLRRRKQSLDSRRRFKLPLFGTEGSELWYYGHKNLSDAKVNLVWDAIEAKTAHQRTERKFNTYPWTTPELQRGLVLPVNDFDDNEAGRLVAQRTQDVLGGDGKIHPRRILTRERWVDWAALLPLETAKPRTRGDVEDGSTTIDVRDRSEGTFTRDTIVATKA